MSSARDPFYIIKEEIQESIDKLQHRFHQWESAIIDTEEQTHLSKEIIVNCKSILWQVDELEKAIAIASKDPVYYQITEIELEKRKKWTASARNQVGNVRHYIEAKQDQDASSSDSNGERKELMKIRNDPTYPEVKSSQFHKRKNDEYRSSESEKQLLLIRQQDEELDELSTNVNRIGSLGLSIREELMGQEKLLEELSSEIETTLNRLDFVQKKIAFVMNRASSKGQIMIIVFLLTLFLVLFFLVFIA